MVAMMLDAHSNNIMTDFMRLCHMKSAIETSYNHNKYLHAESSAAYACRWVANDKHIK